MNNLTMGLPRERFSTWAKSGHYDNTDAQAWVIFLHEYGWCPLKAISHCQAVDDYDLLLPVNVYLTKVEGLPLAA